MAGKKYGKNITFQTNTILFGDINARVGTVLQTWNGVIGPHGLGKCKSNVLLLLKMFSMLIPSSNCPPETEHPKCTHAPNAGISSTKLSSGGAIDRMSRSLKPFAALTFWKDHRLIEKVQVQVQVQVHIFHTIY